MAGRLDAMERNFPLEFPLVKKNQRFIWQLLPFLVGKNKKTIVGIQSER